MQNGIDTTLISDNMAAWVLCRGGVDCVIVGADRVARNGDVANKIGTYGVAISAKVHRIPFYVAAPFSTIDRNLPCGEEIPIEERSPDEVTSLAGTRIAAESVRVYNPAFDVTPAAYVTALISEKGIARAPYAEAFDRWASGEDLTYEERNGNHRNHRRVGVGRSGNPEGPGGEGPHDPVWGSLQPGYLR